MHSEDISQSGTRWSIAVKQGDCYWSCGKTQIGPVDMQFAAVVEFETFEKAMSFKTHPDYIDALKELGPDETKVVKN